MKKIEKKALFCSFKIKFKFETSYKYYYYQLTKKKKNKQTSTLIIPSIIRNKVYINNVKKQQPTTFKTNYTSDLQYFIQF